MVSEQQRPMFAGVVPACVQDGGHWGCEVCCDEIFMLKSAENTIWHVYLCNTMVLAKCRFFFTFTRVWGVCLRLALGRELWINPEEGESFRGNVTSRHASFLFFFNEVLDKSDKLSSPPLLLDSSTAVCKKQTEERVRPKHLGSLWCCSLTVAPLSPPVNHLEWHADLSCRIFQRCMSALPAFTQRIVSTGVWCSL